MIFTGLGRDRADATAPVATMDAPRNTVPVVDDPIQNARDAEWEVLEKEPAIDESKQPGGYAWDAKKKIAEKIVASNSIPSSSTAPSEVRQRSQAENDSE